MPGPTPKPPERRQRRNGSTSVVQFIPRGAQEIPGAPAGILPATKKTWDVYWNSALAGAVNQETDLPAITRLFTLYDERERAYRAFRKSRLVPGSQGQMVLNPMGRAMGDFDAEIRQMEDRLGLTPRSRLMLGITLGAAAQSMADLNAALANNEDDDDSHRNEADPRQHA